MKIIADANIPFVKETYSPFAEVILVQGREINNALLKETDVLLVRSVTCVNEELLHDTNVGFVATSTIGTDHVDEKYLFENKIFFSSAPGSNADSVAEYIVSALLHLGKRNHLPLTDMTMGIIGFGNVGTRVKKRADILGIRCLINDPPLEEVSEVVNFTTLDALLNESDIISVHTPLEKSGKHPTFHLISSDFISKMKKGSILINTSRGSIIDEKTLVSCRGKLGGFIVDVWENEPVIDFATLDAADIATPHIAGYSFDGKVRGAQMIYKAFCDFFSKKEMFDFNKFIKPEKPLIIDLDGSSDLIYDAVRNAYPIMLDDINLRKIKDLTFTERGKYFDRLRKEYAKRREYFNYTVICNTHHDRKSVDILRSLGFIIKYE